MIDKKATLKDVKDFRDWLYKRVGEGARSYDAQDPTNCLVCQYLKARGKTAVMFEGPNRMFVHNGGRHEVRLPISIAKIAYGMDGTLKGRYERETMSNGDVLYTFAEALNRANLVIEKLSR